MNINREHTNMDFGDALKEIMDEKDLSFNKLSYMCDNKVSPQFLNKMVNKKVLPPKDNYIEIIAKALNIKPEYFFEYRQRRFIEYLNKNREFLDKYYAEMSRKDKSETG